MLLRQKSPRSSIYSLVKNQKSSDWLTIAFFRTRFAPKTLMNLRFPRLKSAL
jgi:hypothetical protein